ncbi:hypothetical protein ABIA33_001395 [Streptacidiphilus sp. MAP12-16]
MGGMVKAALPEPVRSGIDRVSGARGRTAGGVPRLGGPRPRGGRRRPRAHRPPRPGRLNAGRGRARGPLPASAVAGHVGRAAVCPARRPVSVFRAGSGAARRGGSGRGRHVRYAAGLLLQDRLMALTPEELSGQALVLHTSGMLTMQGVGRWWLLGGRADVAHHWHGGNGGRLAGRDPVAGARAAMRRGSQRSEGHGEGRRPRHAVTGPRARDFDLVSTRLRSGRSSLYVCWLRVTICHGYVPPCSTPWPASTSVARPPRSPV